MIWDHDHILILAFSWEETWHDIPSQHCIWQWCVVSQTGLEFLLYDYLSTWFFILIVQQGTNVFAVKFYKFTFKQTHQNSSSDSNMNLANLWDPFFFLNYISYTSFICLQFPDKCHNSAFNWPSSMFKWLCAQSIMSQMATELRGLYLLICAFFF